MKVYLPSNGLLGTSTTELAAPTIGKLRKTVDFSASQLIRRSEFVLLHCDVDLNKITIQDRDYLFVILISSLYMDRITYIARCPNGHKSNDFISLEDCTPIRLKKGVPAIVKKKVGPVEYSFRRLSAKNEMDVEEWAMEQPDEFYAQAFDDAYVAMTLFGEVTPDSVAKALAVDVNVYYLALLYSKVDVHGIFLLKGKICSVCNESFASHLAVNGNMLNVNVSQLIDNYIDLNGYLQLSDFYEMTIPEYNTFVSSLNRKINAS